MSAEPSAKAGTDPLVAALRSALSPGQVACAVEDLVVFGYDGTAAMRQRPRVVVFPESTEDVVAVINLARGHRVPVVTRGAGTGLSGGSVPVAGALVLCVSRLNRVLELDAENLTLLVEPGVVTQQVSATAEQAGLFYPPDPGSMKISTIGGNVAENSGGLRGLKYGVTRDYVMGLEVVLADGSTCWLGNKCVKDVAGYNLRDLFIGSEGTLGVITRILLKLLPQPAAKSTLVATFDRMDTAAAVVSEIIAAKIVPCTMEFLDRRTIQCVEAHARLGLATNVEALLLLEADGHPVAAAEEADRMAEIARRLGALSVRQAADATEAARLAAARRGAFSALARLRPTTILEDATVPRSRLAEMVRHIENVAAKHRVEIATFGHFGDGNLHPTFLTDERDVAEMERVEAALAEIVEHALALGGTITGEHGVGLAKKSFLRRQLGDDTFTLLRLVKQALDPDGLLNPGKIFD